MDGFELNKIAAAVLLAGVIAMIVANVTDAIYLPHHADDKRGYSIPVQDVATSADHKAAAPAPVDIPALMAAADASRGAADVKRCAVCHDFTKGGPNRVGPNLWNVLGSPKAHHPGYTYSAALSGLGGNWTYEDLFHFLNDPRKFAPGTKMAFAGFNTPQNIADVIAYLRSLSDSPVALPTGSK